MADLIEEKRRVRSLLQHMDGALVCNDFERAQAYFKLLDKHLSNLMILFNVHEKS